MANDQASESVRTVQRHYTRFWKLFRPGGEAPAPPRPDGPPPFMNLGWWAEGAPTARDAQLELVHQLASRVPEVRGGRVLDVGCGLAGPAVVLARSYGAEVDGVNIVQQQVDLAREYLAGTEVGDRVRVHTGSAMDLPFADESFDVVFSLEAAHCFADKPRFLSEAARVLRPGGTLVLADIIATSRAPLLRWQPAVRLNLATASEWRELVEAAGFVVEEHEKIGKAVYPGFRRWNRLGAPKRRRDLFENLGGADAPLPARYAKRLAAWALEVAYCRSVLHTGSMLGIRDYVLFVARKPAHDGPRSESDVVTASA